MKRRAFITLIAGAAATPTFAPLAARAQPTERVRRIAWLDPVPESDPGARRAWPSSGRAWRSLAGLSAAILRSTIAWAPSTSSAQAARAPSFGMKPDVILCGGSPAVQALQQTNRVVPVVFVLVAEPVAQGFVQNLARPGGNMTGFSYLEPTVGAKWLELLNEIAPRVERLRPSTARRPAPMRRCFTNRSRQSPENSTLQPAWLRLTPPPS